MKRIVLAGLLGAAILHAPLLAQNAAHPLPTQILTAKRVFIGYQGGESNSRLAGYSGGSDRTYNQFYAALKTWRHYEVVSAPAEADLAFEISFSSPLVGSSVSGGAVTNGTSAGVSSTSYTDPQFRLTIFDVKSHMVLWTLVEHVEFARLQGNRDKNFDIAMMSLVNDLARLAGTPPAIVADNKKKEDESGK